MIHEKGTVLFCVTKGYSDDDIQLAVDYAKSYGLTTREVSVVNLEDIVIVRTKIALRLPEREEECQKPT